MADEMYFVPRLKPEALESLVAAGVEYEVMTLEEGEGILFTHPNFSRFRELLEQEGIRHNYVKTETGYHGIFSVHFQWYDPATAWQTGAILAGSVVFVNKHHLGPGDESVFSKIITETIYPVVDKPIQVILGRGEHVSPPADDSVFTICLFSSPISGMTPVQPAPHRLWGRRQADSNWFRPSEAEDTRAVIDDDSGLTVAEIVYPNCLYIPFWVEASFLKGRFDTLRQVLHLAAGILVLLPEEWTEKKRKAEEDRQRKEAAEDEKTLVNLTERLKKQSSGLYGNLVKKRDTERRGLQEASSQLVARLRELEEVSAKEQLLESELKLVREEAESDFSRLVADPRVDKLAIEGSLVFAFGPVRETAGQRVRLVSSVDVSLGILSAYIFSVSGRNGGRPGPAKSVIFPADQVRAERWLQLTAQRRFADMLLEGLSLAAAQIGSLAETTA